MRVDGVSSLGHTCRFSVKTWYKARVSMCGKTICFSLFGAQNSSPFSLQRFFPDWPLNSPNTWSCFPPTIMQIHSYFYLHGLQVHRDYQRFFAFFGSITEVMEASSTGMLKGNHPELTRTTNKGHSDIFRCCWDKLTKMKSELLNLWWVEWCWMCMNVPCAACKNHNPPVREIKRIAALRGFHLSHTYMCKAGHGMEMRV